jgi:hypothetical protein
MLLLSAAAGAAGAAGALPGLSLKRPSIELGFVDERADLEAGLLGPAALAGSCCCCCCCCCWLGSPPLLERLEEGAAATTAAGAEVGWELECLLRWAAATATSSTVEVRRVQ